MLQMYSPCFSDNQRKWKHQIGSVIRRPKLQEPVIYPRSEFLSRAAETPVHALNYYAIEARMAKREVGIAEQLVESKRGSV